MPEKKSVAVIFGGRSPEHDISVVTGLQVVSAIDSSLYDVTPVYIATDGTWFTGEPLRHKSNYLPTQALRNSLHVVKPVPSHVGKLRLETTASGWRQRQTSLDVDIVVPAFHGALGEDGSIQGLFEIAGAAYTGMRRLASTLFMDKAATKRLAASQNLPTLPFRELRRPANGRFISAADLKALVEPLVFPMIVKPSHMGSSIGVARVNTLEELSETLPIIFNHDTAAIVESFIQNMIEYNVSVARLNGTVTTSAIEMPLSGAEILDFKEKYLSSGGKKGPKKSVSTSSEGMLSLTRTINPELAPDLEARIRTTACDIFDVVAGSGAPRMDFIYDRDADALYLNEVNPCPGSFGFFLWEASTHRLGFTDLMDHLIQEAVAERNAITLPSDPVPEGARLFKR